jgi:hypothetical protein
VRFPWLCVASSRAVIPWERGGTVLLNGAQFLMLMPKAATADASRLHPGLRLRRCGRSAAQQRGGVRVGCFARGALWSKVRGWRDGAGDMLTILRFRRERLPRTIVGPLSIGRGTGYRNYGTRMGRSAGPRHRPLRRAWRCTRTCVTAV